MKKIIMIFSAFILFSACQKIEDLNQNTKDPSAVAGETLFTGAQKNLFDQMVSANVNLNVFRLFAQQWTQTTYTDESKYDLVTRGIPDGHWDVLYRDVLKDLKESARIIDETYELVPAVKKNKLAIIEIVNVYTWSILVETFGNIPYSEALDINKPLPKYDDGITVYKDLITRLNTALTNLDVANSSFGVADLMYQGDVAQWIKFANSLKLRMGMLLSDVDAAYARIVVEQAAPNVFTSNADNGRIQYEGAQPNANPIYDDLVASGRHDFVAANTLVDSMSSLNDPRMPFYFTQIGGLYVGGLYGESNAYSQCSHVAPAIQQPAFEGLILDYVEVEFLLAEAAELTFNVGGTAESHYNAAITASITYWGGTAAEITTYLADPRVAYSTAAGTYKQKIGMQKWIAMYNRGFEAWTSWRKLDYPLLVPPPDAVSVIPVRFTYPVVEQTLNGTNYAAASSAIGGDAVGTRLFWDKF